MNVLKALCGSRRSSWDSREIAAEGLYAPDKPACPDWRKERLAIAASKYGRPFKCAGQDMPREVFVGGRVLVIVSGGEKPDSVKGTYARRALTLTKRPRLTVMQGT